MIKYFFVIFLIAFVYLDNSARAQCMMVEVPLSQRASVSSVIFEGKVIDKKSFWNPAHTLIYTSHLIEVYKVFKGNISTSKIELITEGGTVGYNMHVVTPNLGLGIDDIGVFFGEIENSLPAAFSSSDSANEPVKTKSPSPSSSLPRFKPYANAQGFLRYNLYAHSAADPFKKYSDIKTDVYKVLTQYTAQPYKEVKAMDVYQFRNHGSRVAPSVTSFSPTTITAGTFDTLTINGSDFGSTRGTSTVAFSNADDAGSTIVSTGFTSDYVSWSNTQIKVIIHSQAGTGSVYVTTSGGQGSKSGLTIPYAQTIINGSGSPYEPNLVDINAAGGYTYKYSTSTANSGVSFDASANDSAKARFESALSTWRCNTGFNVLVSGNTSIGAPAANDGTSVVTYDNSSNALSAGVLGTGYSYYSSCDGTNWYVPEIDITFKRDGTGGVTWYTGSSTSGQPGGSTDFESVALHELGHTHQMKHVINTSNTLHYSLTTGTNRRTLLSDNINCGDYIIGHSTSFSSCSKTGMSVYDCALPPVAGFTSDSQGGCGTPQTITFSDLSTNGPTSWNWTFGDGGTSTSQNPSHAYNSAGVYDVQLIAANSNGSDTITQTGYIAIGSSSTSVCSVNTTDLANSYGMGIINFTFNTINNTTNDAVGDGGYQDFNCSLTTSVTRGSTYAVSVTTGPVNNEDVRIYVDYNNDGDFTDSGETVFTSDNQLENHSGNITIPCTATTGVMLKMRVVSDWYGNTISGGCYNSTYGQTEDYGLLVSAITTAAAGSDQSVCTSTATLAGNTPSVGTGAWSLISGSGTITDASSPTSGITSLGTGTNTFRWTITNGSCTSTDDVIITRDETPTTASAGSDQNVCATTATLAGNTPSVGTGAWSLISGSGTITDATSPTSGITGLGSGVNTFRWTISNGSCTASMDDVIITRNTGSTITWTGTTNTDWNTASNWSPATVPTSCDDVIIPNTTNKPTISTAGMVCKNITINTTDGAVLTISGSGTLTVSD